MRGKSVSTNFLFADGCASYRNAGFVDGFLPSRHQRMPPAKVTPLVEQAVGASFRKPVQTPDAGWRQLDAIWNMAMPVFIIGTPTGAEVQELASKARYGYLARIVILKLYETALSAAVAQSFPLIRRHFAQLLGFPKRLSHSLLEQLSRWMISPVLLSRFLA